MFVDEVVALPAPLAVAWDRLSPLVDAGWQDAATDAFDQGRQLLLAGVVDATKHVIAGVCAGRHDGDSVPVGDGGAGG